MSRDSAIGKTFDYILAGFPLSTVQEVQTVFEQCELIGFKSRLAVNFIADCNVLVNGVILSAVDNLCSER
jgi:hypothetical protein